MNYFNAINKIIIDSVVLPFKSEKINMSFGCYGCRDSTDEKPNEAVICEENGINDST
ncbi:MAG: DUF169 domain-containing protein [Bacteroidetes bacterium]|nr:DUF169 domain-containing protein [Bacteroidota bacterium]